MFQHVLLAEEAGVTPFDPRLPIIAAQARVKTCHVLHCWLAMRETGKRFHIAAFANFTGLEERHVTAIIDALIANDALPDKRSPVTQRATRLDRDWTLPPEWADWATDKRRWEPADTIEEAANFAAYWQTKAKDATKLDWCKTWQVWVRNSRRPDGTYHRSAGPMVSNREHMERTAALYERMGRGNEAAEIRANLASYSNVVPITARI